VSRAIQGVSHIAAIEMGREAVAIGESGQYTAPSGRLVEIGAQIETAVKGTVAYPPDNSLVDSQPGDYATQIEIVNETTLAATTRLIAQGYHPVALNFASATHPGGGFLSGALAQEEYLARSSALYQCIRRNVMYHYHRRHYDPMYSDYMLYSPHVPVFRDSNGIELLEEPYTVSMITAAAVNANQLPWERRTAIRAVMWPRILKVLAVGLHHGHNAIVLGAWGCGAFGNDGNEIARLFARALTENFRGAYGAIVFAILDWSPERRFIQPFASAFNLTARDDFADEIR
jgi:uncharacterized protein (TIGR02452 family)